MVVVQFLLFVSLLLYSPNVAHSKLGYRNRNSFSKLFGGGVVRGDNIPELLTLIDSSNRGVLKFANEEIKCLIDTIASKNSQFIDNDKNLVEKIDGNWELLWTTEKETLFFVQNGLFGNPVNGVFQSIDVKNRVINNLIRFRNGGEFSVQGSIDINLSEKKRVNFEFQGAYLKIPPVPKIPIPPVGKGWFDNLYVNNLYRLSKDIRGDYLVSKRVLT